MNLRRIGKFLNGYVLLIFGITTMNVVQAQDTLVLMNGQKEIVKVLEINTAEISYKKANYPDGPSYKIPIYELKRVCFPNGMKEVFVDYADLTKDQDTSAKRNVYYLMGLRDANRYYDNRGAGTACLLTSLFLTPATGLIVAITISIFPPASSNYETTNKVLLNNTEYLKGYKKRAWLIKQQRAWSNWTIGTAGWGIAVVSIISFRRH